MKPIKEDAPDYYDYYINLVLNDKVTNALTENKNFVTDFIKKIPSHLENYAYEKNKWTIKEVLIHIIDTERILSTRALGFARGDENKPNAFDENFYVSNAYANSRSLIDVVDEFEAVRDSTIALFRSFSDIVLDKIGETPSGKATVNSIGFFICGHATHHLNVINGRYLSQTNSILI